MPYLDIFLLISCILTCFYCSFVLIRMALDTPIPMFYFFLAVSILSLGINFLLILPIYTSEFSLLSPFFIFILSRDQGVLVLRISQFFAIFFVLSFTIITFTPLIKVNTESMAIVIFATMFSTATYIIDMNTIAYTVTDDKIHIAYNIVGAIFLLISLAILVFVLLIRFQEIRFILSKKGPNPNLLAKRNFYILILLTIVTFILSRQVDFFPTYSWAGFSTIGILYLTYFFKKDKSFYFISNTRLEAVIVLITLSGKVQFYRNFQNVNMLITGVMTAFNISIKHLISSQTDIQQVFFEDKALLMKKGEFTTTILFVTEKSIISDSITNYLSKKFEENYHYILQGNPYGVDDLRNFQSFEKYISQIISYFSI